MTRKENKNKNRKKERNREKRGKSICENPSLLVIYNSQQK